MRSYAFHSLDVLRGNIESRGYAGGTPSLAVDFFDNRLAGNSHANESPAQPDRQQAGNE